MPSKVISEDAIRQSRAVNSNFFSPLEREWLEQICDGDGVAYFFTPDECEQMQVPLQLLDHEIDIEMRCSRRAAEDQLLGIYLPEMKFLPMRCLQASLATTADPSDQRHPLIAGVGRLICHAEFQERLTELKEQRRSISQNDLPAFPWDRESIAGSIAAIDIKEFVARELGNEEPNPAVRKFLKAVQKVLHDWDLHSLITWDFPEPLGDDTTSALPMEMHLQNRFPAALSESTEEFQRRLAAALDLRREELGTADLLKRAESYAQFARLHRWDKLISSRTRATGTGPLNSTNRVGLLADMIGCSEGHVRRLLDLMDQLKTGKISQLPLRSTR